MDLSKLTYSKGDSARTPQKLVPKAASEVNGRIGSSDIMKVSPAYSKSDGILSTNLVFVLSGGEKREKDFLRELIVQREFHSLRVAFMSEKGQGLQPYQMQERWLGIQSAGMFKIESQVYHLGTADRVFLLSDVDEFYDQLSKINSGNTGRHGCQWIVSNPCFEIWLYYCYLNRPEKDLECLISEPAATRSRKLKTLGHTLVSGGLNPCKAFERMNVGIENSRRHWRTDENGIPVLFATQMHDMAQYLVDIMNQNADEYSEHVRRKGEWRRLMKK